MKNETARREIELLDYYLQNHTNDYSEKSHTAMMMAIEALDERKVELFDDGTLVVNVKGGIKRKRIKKIPPEAVKIVRCKECQHANECHKSVQYTHNESNSVTIGFSPIEWCSRGKRREP